MNAFLILLLGMSLGFGFGVFFTAMAGAWKNQEEAENHGQ